MNDIVLQTVPLGPQWPTADPFLFCAHHHDEYPLSNGRYGPAGSLEGRTLGQDFAGVDGWNMYHGRSVPGFPQHPHRGFETITFVRRGIIDHSDSLGATARFGSGDVQWMTAGKGIVHSEMFPLLREDGPNPLQMFQIWLNLPASDKLVDPYFTMLWARDIPKVTIPGATGDATVTVVAGSFDGQSPPPPPPNSWAARPEADVAVWHLELSAGATLELPPPANAETGRTLYLFGGPQVSIGDTVIGSSTGAVVASDRTIELTAPDQPVELMMLQGRPIGEPVARYGPFVMNTNAEIQQAFADYQETRFGGWPWPSDDPVHTDAAGRFARHADGKVEEFTHS